MCVAPIFSKIIIRSFLLKEPSVGIFVETVMLIFTLLSTKTE